MAQDLLSQGATQGQYTYQAPTTKDFIDLVKTPDEKKANIPQYLLDLLSEIAVANELEVILRPVNPDALWHMNNGAVAKGMPIHGKSAISGPTRGLIPCNASISKAGSGGDLDTIRKFQEENEHSFHQSKEDLKLLEGKLQFAASSILRERPDRSKDSLTGAEIMEKAGISKDSFDTIVEPVTLLTTSGKPIFIFENNGIAAKDSEGPLYAIKVGDQYQKIDADHNPIGAPFESKDHGEAVPVKVFGKPSIKISSSGTISFEDVKPITADVDVLAYGAKRDLLTKGPGNYEEIKVLEGKRTIAKKSAALRESGFKLTDESVVALSNQDIGKTIEYFQSIDLRDRPKSSKQRDELVTKLTKIENERLREDQLEQLKSYGDTSAPIRAIVGALRADLEKYEISHGSEQLNYNFTQALDKEWVRVDREGVVSIIKNEAELLGVFSKIREDGYNMPPNPNWGWKLNDAGKYEVDDKLREQNKFVDRLMFVATDNKNQQTDIMSILDKRLALGKLSVNLDNNQEVKHDKRVAEIIKLKGELDAKIQKYEKRYVAPPEIGEKIPSWMDRNLKSREKHESRMSKGSSTSSLVSRNSASALRSSLESRSSTSTLKSSNSSSSLVSRNSTSTLRSSMSSESTTDDVEDKKLPKNAPKLNLFTRVRNKLLPMTGVKAEALKAVKDLGALGFVAGKSTTATTTSVLPRKGLTKDGRGIGESGV